MGQKWELLVGNIVACLRGDREVVALLLRKGDQVNVGGGQYGNPSHIAAIDGHVEVAKLLIEHGADVGFTICINVSALKLACKGDHTRLPGHLIAHGPSSEALDDENHTPLHHAARVVDAYLAEILLDRGVVVDGEDADGYTALA